MKINRLKILTRFRGLKPGYEVSFNNIISEERIEPICFVGLNGSGKSNILEAISECFYYLEAYSEERAKSELKKYKTTFGFDIEFELNPAYQDLNISWENLEGFTWTGTGNIKIRYIKNENELPIMMFPDSQKPIKIEKRENFILPNRIVGYSSGMNELISNPFIKIDFFYLEKLREQSKGLDTYRPQLNRMFLMDYEANKIITICSQIFKHENSIKILNDEINIEDISSFTIYHKNLRYNYQPCPMPPSIEVIVEKLLKCATTYEIIRAGKGEKYRLDFKIDENSREAFFDNWNNAFELFRDLYQLRLLNMFLIPDYLIKKARDVEKGKNLISWLPKTTSINQIFFIDEIYFIGKNKETIPYKHLSDGEHQLLHALSGLMLLEARNSIFILDEPDTHFNPEWRSRFVFLLNKVLNPRMPEQLIFITSHSPYVISDCKQQNVFLFKKGQQPRNPQINTYGTSVGLLTDEIFKKSNSISESAQKELEKISKKITRENVNEIVEQLNSKYGDSVEKIALFQKLSKLIKQPLKK